jgi:hypothetical protein
MECTDDGSHHGASRRFASSSTCRRKRGDWLRWRASVQAWSFDLSSGTDRACAHIGKRYHLLMPWPPWHSLWDLGHSEGFAVPEHELTVACSHASAVWWKSSSSQRSRNDQADCAGDDV